MRSRAGAAGTLLVIAAMGAVMTPAGAAPAEVVPLVSGSTGTDADGDVPAGAPAMADPTYDAEVVALMAATSGRTVAAQEQRLERQAASNTTLAALQRAGHDFDGAFLADDGGLVVRATPGTPDARAATAAGATVAPARFGEAELAALADELAELDPTGVSTVQVDVAADRLVVGTAGDVSAEAAAFLAEHDAAVAAVDTPAYSTNAATVRGGDAVYTPGGGRCSAGFPARDRAGARYMIWAGHCNEGGGTFTSGGERIGTSAGSAFTSYDGTPDRDIGALRIDADDTVVTRVNPYGTSGYNLDAPLGASRPAVGTELCKSGSTTGITCGRITGYDVSVNYTDAQGRQVAQVSGLMTTTVCTEGGDSGGAYTTGGYAVGLTSGGPSTQRCTYNGGFQSGKSSLVQPVTDALAYYGLTYG